jgi:hypothetical protein
MKEGRKMQEGIKSKEGWMEGNMAKEGRKEDEGKQMKEGRKEGKKERRQEDTWRR